MEIFLIGFVAALAAVGIAIARLFPPGSERDQLFGLLSGRLRWFKPAAPAPLPPSPPEPDEPGPPALIYGSNPMIDSELAVEPDLRDAYRFPEKHPPVLRYDDFNRRLVIFRINNGAAAPPDRLYPTHVNDSPIRLSGTLTYLEQLVTKQFRPAYNVIVDPHGIFARCSDALERDPLVSLPFIEAVLRIPEDDRPVIFSVTNGEKAMRPEFVLRRYGFSDMLLNPEFVKDRWTDALPIIFKALAGPERDWLYFSHARLRHELVEGDRTTAEMQRRLEEQMRAKERDDASTDTRQTFAEIFAISDRSKEREPTSTPDVAAPSEGQLQ